ncbi:hypothetical protein [Armatimonas sp.]|uniref:hypothetical protein n=1 Tax=Armatimonas sp. TaxID=1872638 RepID=UPI00286C8040|nr:hypothetical protein [Armatimonas sp.]
MQEREHGHDDVRQSKGVPGYMPDRPVTRYELAATLFQLLTHVEAAYAQPKRVTREVKPGRKANLTPNPAKAKRYSDVPALHWASASVSGLGARGIVVAANGKFEGEKTVAGDELAHWLDGMAGWVEGRPVSAKSLRELVRAGYLPQTDPLLKKTTKPVSAQEVATVAVAVLTRAQEKVTTAAADSRFGK